MYVIKRMLAGLLSIGLFFLAVLFVLGVMWLCAQFPFVAIGVLILIAAWVFGDNWVEKP